MSERTAETGNGMEWRPKPSEFDAEFPPDAAEPFIFRASSFLESPSPRGNG
jgi:hypothetical protein